jgi:hypothetical protein
VSEIPANPAAGLDRQSHAAARFSWVVFVVLLVLHAFLTFRNLDQGMLPGHEFRQAQTALSILFIQKEHDYSLAYPTPLFGPPWSIPMEFPLYQWSAAWLGNQTGWSVATSGRVISILCFYLTLPALFLILRAVSLPVAVRWSVLSLSLSAPIYIFYTRAVLIESMALMFALWFLFCFIRMCQRQSYAWMTLAAIVGSAAVLIKVTSMIAWCSGVAVGGLWWSWQQWRQHGWSAWQKSLLLGVGCAVPIGLVNLWWLQTADAIKAASPGGAVLISSNLSTFNFGTWSDRLNVDYWAQILTNAHHAVTPLWALAIATVGAVVIGLRQGKWWTLTAALWFCAVLLTFPVLYRIHDYYFYAIALLPLVAIATFIHHLARLSRRGWWIESVLIIALVGVQLHGYSVTYAPGQLIVSNGGQPSDNLIRDATASDEVIIVLGQDWSAATPYYAERKALMLGAAALQQTEYWHQLLESLTDETVSALIVTDKLREDQEKITTITKRFGLDPEPTASSASRDLYIATSRLEDFLSHLTRHPNYAGVSARLRPPPQIPTQLDEIVSDGEIHPVTSNQAETVFTNIKPAPHAYRAQFGISTEFIANRYATGAHPDSDILVSPPPSSRGVDLLIGIRDKAYENPHDRTDGVTFTVTAVSPTGERTVLFDRFLQPATLPEDRGTVAVRIEFPATEFKELIFSTRPGPHGNYAFDWAYWSQIHAH